MTPAQFLLITIYYYLLKINGLIYVHTAFYGTLYYLAVDVHCVCIVVYKLYFTFLHCALYCSTMEA